MVDTSAPNTVWVVDDDEGMCNAIQDLLRPKYSVQYFTEIDKIESALNNDCPGVLILDLKFGMNESAGLEFLERIRKRHKYLPVIVCSVRDDVEAALIAGRYGVVYYVQKKVDGSFSMNLLHTVDNVFIKTVPDVLIAQIIDDSDFFFRITRRTLDSCDHVVQHAMRCYLKEISTIGPSVTKLTERAGYSAETLNNHFKTHFKQPVGDFLRYFAVIIGCYMHLCGHSVAESAENVGMHPERFRRRVWKEFEKPPRDITREDLP